jgi:N4-gp56 family major capsid protein
MALTNYGHINQRTAAYAAKQMLAHAEPILVLSKFGQSKPLPKNTADTVKFRRPKPFGVLTTQTPLTEGEAPAPQQMNYEDVQVQLKQYGGVTKITDVVQDLAEDPVLSDASMLSGEQAAETIEMLTWGTIKGGTNAMFDTADHLERSEVDSKISLNRLRAIVRSLKGFRGKPVTQIMGSSVNYATQSVEGGYIAFCHTDCEADVRDLPGFTHLADYGSRKPLCPEEIGSVESIRFIMTPLLEPFATSDAEGRGAVVGSTGMVGVDSRTAAEIVTANSAFSGTAEEIATAIAAATAAATFVSVYPIVVIAKGAYGLVPLKGAKAIVPSVLNPGTPSKSDPLGQVGYVGWKAYFASVILNQTWMTRLEVGVSDI